MDGYTITPETRAALAEFRKTLDPEESELRICPQDCTEDHDAIWRDE